MTTEITTNDLKCIVNDMENICVRMQNVNLESVDRFDKLSLMYNMKQLAQMILKQASL
jgi:hypothetical protein